MSEPMEFENRSILLYLFCSSTVWPNLGRPSADTINNNVTTSAVDMLIRIEPIFSVMFVWLRWFKLQRMHWHHKLIRFATCAAHNSSLSLTLMNLYFFFAGFSWTPLWGHFKRCTISENSFSLCALILDDALCCWRCCVAVNHTLTALSQHGNWMYSSTVALRRDTNTKQTEKWVAVYTHAFIRGLACARRIETDSHGNTQTIFSTPSMPDQRGYVSVWGYTNRVKM